MDISQSLNPIFSEEKLEEQTKERRTRIEQWRMMNALKKAQREEEEGKKKDDENPKKKKWNLENDSEDEEENVDNKAVMPTDDESEKKEETEDEIDPLDAFMMQLNGSSSKPEVENVANGNGPKVSRIVGTTQKEKKVMEKGELMFGNEDAMEYSSEEEDESLGEALSNFQNKQQPRKLEVTVDHSKIHYERFTKNFYIEVPEIAAMTPEEVEHLRNEELEGVKIKGRNCPRPILQWVHAGVNKKILKILKDLKYEKPTPIQAQAIPAIMAGNDMIGIAKTGSGKTLAFLLPMFRHIMAQRPLEYGDGPIAVIMTPTRELALQIHRECHKFARKNELKSCCVYGGTGISEQIAELKRGAEIIVCTPGRMIDMLYVNKGGVTNMRRCTYLVMDEADRMFDMGFEPQVRQVINSCRPDRQLVLFSATFNRHMEALARQYLVKPVEVQIGGRSVVCSDVEQIVVVMSEQQKFLKLLELLGDLHVEGSSTLIFVDKQERADNLLKDLIDHNWRGCMSLHGGIDQYDRDSIITDFKNGVCTLLVATSVAARGLDVRNLKLVVNFNCPNHYEDYVHRCGRTGRAGQKGKAYTFITSDQSRYSGEIIKALELSNTEVPSELEKMWLEFKNEQQSQGKKVKSSQGGFSGRGFKFDENEATMLQEKKQAQKAQYGMQDSEDENDTENIDDKIESLFNSKKTVKDISRPIVNEQTQSVADKNQAGLERAKLLASKININKSFQPTNQLDVMQQAANSFMRGGTFQAPEVAKKTHAQIIAERINQKINYHPGERDDLYQTVNSEAGKHYEEELEINGFPQTCRYKVCARDALNEICDYSETSITIRGQYYPPGQKPETDQDERKLYLAIEAPTELAVQKARSEITRIIKEELIRLQNYNQPMNKGRYKLF